MMLEILGKIEFDPVNVTKKHNKQSSWKKSAMVRFGCDLPEYYSFLIEKEFGIKLNRPLRGSHITVINDIVDDDIYKECRKLFQNKELRFQYDPSLIFSNEGHWFIRVFSDDVRNIRIAMGLSPDPYHELHLTIGLATHLQLEQSKYILGIHKYLKVNGK